MGHEFTIRREVALPATAEQVFAAVTTGAAGWMFPTDDMVGPGGAGPDNPIVTSWDPPTSSRIRMEGEDGWFNALENIIEARGGGTCVLRYVHSGIMVDDWECQYDGADKHTTFYLHSLGQYVRYFSGRPVTYVAVNGPASAATPDALEVLARALGLTGKGSDGHSFGSGDGARPAPASRARPDRGRCGLPQLPFHRVAQRGRAVPLLRPERLRRSGRRGAPPVCRRGGPGQDRAGLADLAGRCLRLKVVPTTWIQPARASRLDPDRMTSGPSEVASVRSER